MVYDPRLRTRGSLGSRPLTLDFEALKLSIWALFNSSLFLFAPLHSAHYFFFLSFKILFISIADWDASNRLQASRVISIDTVVVIISELQFIWWL